MKQIGGYKVRHKRIIEFFEGHISVFIQESKQLFSMSNSTLQVLILFWQHRLGFVCAGNTSKLNSNTFI